MPNIKQCWETYFKVTKELWKSGWERESRMHQNKFLWKDPCSGVIYPTRTAYSIQKVRELSIDTSRY